MGKQDFKANAYMTLTNSCGYELQIDGESARYRLIGVTVIATGFWQEIRWSSRKGPYIRDWHGNKPSGKLSRTHRRLYLSDFIAIR